MESDIQDCPLLLLAQVIESMMARGENRIRETRGVGRNVKIKIPGLFVVSGFSVRNCKICWDSKIDKSDIKKSFTYIRISPTDLSNSRLLKR